MAMAETSANDGGIVVALFLASGTISLAISVTVSLYELSTRKSGVESDDGNRGHARLLRLLSGWANLGNAAIHLLLLTYMLSNSDNESEYWMEERKLGGIEGPVGLALFNLAAGLSATRNFTMKFPLGWNTFVALAGTLVPVVWLRFLEGGMANWPYPIVFVWFCIFFFELTAVCCSVGHVLIEGASDSKGKTD
eukprot:CAMPEP_0172543988 /NCGR_PEP_ID=MMETSP1067-20121228/14249_1 /TAXON_ID=265564 ORGANISM="Thalassiosira punctigera, Strain Tpunct2005C2" /NCGR_SAMPLE_ID=MMETSP1067 /ASSEMBLY_ACC=CAM_ASM_000444 /LENGTH=193 /DNA_ID=CAMNT_0013330483 /DNA_START=26 /DNA_END=607 /DNA_ORIENTATION=-